jgi:hypothetical protein
MGAFGGVCIRKFCQFLHLNDGSSSPWMYDNWASCSVYWTRKDLAASCSEFQIPFGGHVIIELLAVSSEREVEEPCFLMLLMTLLESCYNELSFFAQTINVIFHILYIFRACSFLQPSVKLFLKRLINFSLSNYLCQFLVTGGWNGPILSLFPARIKARWLRRCFRAKIQGSHNEWKWTKTCRRLCYFLPDIKVCNIVYYVRGGGVV